MLGQHVDLEVHAAPVPGGTEVRALERLRDQRHVKAAVVDRATVSETPSTAIEPLWTT